MTLTPFRVEPRAFHELIVMPQFGDIKDVNGNITSPSTEDGDWAVIDGVVTERPILDIFGNQNVLKRRDATCKLIYSPVARLGARYIRTEKLYAAVEDCVDEFYQGAFEDYSQENFDIFGENVMPILEKGVATDLYTNKWFGDKSRPSDVNGLWSWNKFDGIFTHLAAYRASDVITAGQTFAIPAGELTPAQANSALKSAFDGQDDILNDFEDIDKCFYVDKKLANAYHDYLIQSGVTVIADRMSGMPIMLFKGILVKPKAWNGVLRSLNSGTEAHAVILTLKGNFLYGADSTYGGGPRRNEAVRIWWSDDLNVWKRQIHLKAGTELVAPQHVVFGLTEF